MNDIQIFNNPEFGQIRTINHDGEPWFVGKDVALALGYTNPQKAIRDHVDEQDKGVNETFTPGGKQALPIINESGLYSLVLSSKLPTAKKFKRWVTSEVLPSIRKTGSYAVPNVSHTGLQALDLIVQSLHEQHDAMNRLQVNMTSQGAEIERLKAQNELNREAFGLNADNWRKNANAVVCKIVLARTGGMTSGQGEVFEDTWNEVYLRMDARGLNMKRRLANLQHDFPNKKIPKLEVIDRASDRKRLINDLRSVLCEMCVYYGVRLTTEQARTITESQPSEQTSLF